MNQRIKELAYQANLLDDDGWNTSNLTMTTEDFAKLIIKDCISTYHLIDNGNLVEGTDYLPKALYKRYGLE
jgi:hypothetical protein